MAVNLTNADNALKTFYLDAISEQLDNNTSPFLAAIEKNTNDVYGKEVRKLVTYGMNGGIGAGTEDGDLPRATGNNYGQIVTTLKNLYGVIEISDKAIRASENNSGAFVSLLNAEMQGLINSSKFNFNRMLFGDGSGTLSKVREIVGNYVYPKQFQNFTEGMILDFRDAQGNLIEGATGRRIVKIDRLTNGFMLSGSEVTSDLIPDNSLITLHGSYNNELTGLNAIFDPKIKTLYGMSKEENSWFAPSCIKQNENIDQRILQKALDEIESISGTPVNLIICSWGVRRRLVNMLTEFSIKLDTVELPGGFKGLNFNGVPIVVDKFCPSGTMYLLNTNDFVLHQLCDWQWLADDNGKVLKQVPGKPVYTATLVKYAELVCNRPIGQGIITGISED